ncbi:uncharacterized protein G2W53_030514 [Senna tora]|uniref:Uncharacterized protein n=1 Tax=Senna tora TaxID=362788 RepID=A0A834WAU9_9FABA|nr:uncharacterized protein G2W53_030514 [Senna tora]
MIDFPVGSDSEQRSLRFHIIGDNWTYSQTIAFDIEQNILILIKSDHGNGNVVCVEESFRMKQNDRFLCRVMAKEACVANCSSRVLYYGEAAVGVPFMWETQPGTPKHPLMSDQNTLPPLTPPPSYYSNSKSTNSTNSRNSKFHRIFSSILLRKPHVSPSSSSRSSFSSSSSSWSLVYSSSLNSFSVRQRGDEAEVCLSHSRSPMGIPKLKRRRSSGLRGIVCCYPFANEGSDISHLDHGSGKIRREGGGAGGVAAHYGISGAAIE